MTYCLNRPRGDEREMGDGGKEERNEEWPGLSIANF